MLLREEDLKESVMSHDTSVKCYTVPVTNQLLKKSLVEFRTELVDRLERMERAYKLLIKRRVLIDALLVALKKEG